MLGFPHKAFCESSGNSAGGSRAIFDCVLLYAARCARYRVAKELLREAGIADLEIRLNDLPQDHHMRRYAPPTLLCDGRIIFGSLRDGGVSLPVEHVTELELLRRIYRDSDT